MAQLANLEFDIHLEDDGGLSSVERDVYDGITAEPKTLPSKYFYDERGSQLFERITALPEYYLTRAETALLGRSAAAIARRTRVQELIELGSGAARKIRLLIDAALAEGTLRRYVPVEVSRGIVEHSARTLAASYPEIEVHALIGDFQTHLEKVPGGGNRLVALLGSTIGNFYGDEAAKLLRNVRALLGPDDWFLLGTDLVKDREILTAAYNDSQGVTAEFNLNILRVINRRVGGNFDPAKFEHVAVYNERLSRIESSLRSKVAQAVRLEGIDLDVNFRAGELLQTEISCKYTRESITELLAAAGLHLRHWFTDPERSFALSLSRTRAS